MAAGEQTNNGKAFEYACLMSLFHYLNEEQEIVIEDTPQLRTAKAFYEQVSAQQQQCSLSRSVKNSMLTMILMMNSAMIAIATAKNVQLVKISSSTVKTFLLKKFSILLKKTSKKSLRKTAKISKENQKQKADNLSALFFVLTLYYF